MNYYILFYAILSFLVVGFMTPWLIRYLRKIRLVVKDQNKKDRLLVPISGGLAVLTGVFSGLLVFVFFRTFFASGVPWFDEHALLLLFTSMLSILIITLVGFLDDLVIRKDKEASSGLRRWQKPLMTLSAAIPLMVVSAGVAKIWVPFVGGTDFGILYPLVLIPLGVVGAANMVNMLAGFNGMETGMGIVYIGSLGLYAYTHQRYVAALIALVTFSALLGFYYYNKFPARILPGDSLTYLLGGTLAVIAIVGNIEKAALIVSVPFFVEFFLKARSKFRAQSYGYWKDGKIFSKYNGIYSITHFFIKNGKFTERQITYIMIGIELVFASLIWVV